MVTDSSAVLLNKGVGISSEGNLAELQLRSKASVRKNTGGGVAAAGKVTMWGQAVISGNSAEEGAGFNGSAALTMNDSSSIKWNSAVYDGGRDLRRRCGRLTMNDSSTVTANSSQYGLSGGLYATRGRRSWASPVHLHRAPMSSGIRPATATSTKVADRTRYSPASLAAWSSTSAPSAAPGQANQWRTAALEPSGS